MESFAKPLKHSDLQVAFSINPKMPAMCDIPKDYENKKKWERWQSKWFFGGLTSFPEAKDGIDPNDAKRHLRSIQGSFEPKHEHKVAAVAYLASLWLRLPADAD